MSQHVSTTQTEITATDENTIITLFDHVTELAAKNMGKEITIGAFTRKVAVEWELFSQLRDELLQQNPDLHAAFIVSMTQYYLGHGGIITRIIMPQNKKE